jgi:hypothetical protein
MAFCLLSLGFVFRVTFIVDSQRVAWAVSFFAFFYEYLDQRQWDAV